MTETGWRRRTRSCCFALAAFAASTPAAAQHVFDLDARMPPKLAIMFSMAWFGVADSDPQGGDDPSYGNWKQNFPSCGLYNDPATCVDVPGAGLQRDIASKRRPLAGIYSASGRSAESLERIDLMLSTVRRACDDGAKLDAFAIQIDSVKFSSKYPENKQSITWDIAWRAQNAFLDRAELGQMNGSVVVALDATIYWHFGDAFGLTTQDARKAALTDDLGDMATLAANRPGALTLGGRPLLAMYVDSPLMTPAEWQSVLDAARAKSGVDFYALGTTLNSSYFAAFDALVPWVNLGIWKNTSGATLREHAKAWSESMHDGLVAAVGNYPGRVVFGALAPGFDDYTEEWGKCTVREIPRDAEVLEGQLDYLIELRAAIGLSGLFLQTWDDWTEGSEFEPDVVEGTAKLVQLRQGLGKLFGESADPAGDAALDARWTSFGQPKNCCFAGGACPEPGPPIELVCPSTGGSGGTAGSGANAGSGGSAASAASAGLGGAPFGGASGIAGTGASTGNAASSSESDSGCGCSLPGRDRGGAAWLVTLAAALALALRRRLTSIG